MKEIYLYEAIGINVHLSKDSEAFFVTDNLNLNGAILKPRTHYLFVINSKGKVEQYQKELTVFVKEDAVVPPEEWEYVYNSNRFLQMKVGKVLVYALRLVEPGEKFKIIGFYNGAALSTREVDSTSFSRSFYEICEYYSRNQP